MNGIDVQIRTKLSGKEADALEAFVRTHPDGNVFQSPAMFEANRDVPGYQPVCLFARREKEIRGSMMAVLVRSGKGSLSRILTTRSLILGGPLVNDDNEGILGALLENYGQFIGKRAVYTEVRNTWDTEKFKPTFLNSGLKYQKHLNILIDLKQPEEELWKQVHSKRRNEIRRAIKEGTAFVQDNRPETLKTCYGILKEVYQRARHPLPPLAYFESLHTQLKPGGNLKLFTAAYEGKTIGCMLTLTYKSTVYDLYAGSMKEYYPKYPNDLITWEVIRWARHNGYQAFDFGGAGKPGIPYGVRDYKLKFGGRLIESGRYQKIHRPLLYNLAKTALNLYKKMRG